MEYHKGLKVARLKGRFEGNGQVSQKICEKSI